MLITVWLKPARLLAGPEGAPGMRLSSTLRLENVEWCPPLYPIHIQPTWNTNLLLRLSSKFSIVFILRLLHMQQMILRKVKVVKTCLLTPAYHGLPQTYSLFNFLVEKINVITYSDIRGSYKASGIWANTKHQLKQQTALEIMLLTTLPITSV